MTPENVSSRVYNNKKLGHGFVKEEAKIIDAITTPKKEIKNVLDDIISKVEKKNDPKPSKQKKMIFDEEEEEEKEVVGKKVPIVLNSTDIAKFQLYMEIGRGKIFSYEQINGLKKLFDNDKHINKTMKKSEIEKYLVKTYKTNFPITKK